MDRATARKLGENLQALVKDQFPGLKVTVKSGTFDNTTYTVKVEFAEIGANGVAESTEYKDLKIMAQMYGIQDAIGKPLVSKRNGDIVKLVGYNHKARKYPWVIETRGARYKVDNAYLRLNLGLTLAF